MSNSQPEQSPDSSSRRDRDPLNRAMGGMILILLGVVFFLAQSGMLGITWVNMWGAFIIGLGLLLMLQGVLRLVLPDYRRNVFGLLVGGLVLVAVGTIPFGGAMWAQWWPLGLIALGVVLLIQQFVRW